MPPSKRTVVETTPFPTTVTIYGDVDDAVLVYVTYHDVGLNHRWCFGKLLSQMNGSGMLEKVAVVNIDVPGHEDGADALDLKAVGMGAAAAAFNLEALALQLHVVVEKLALPTFVGIGIGAGTNVLCRYATDRPGKVAGIVACNPALDLARRPENIALYWCAKMLTLPVPMYEWACANVANLHFSERELTRGAPRAFRRSFRVSQIGDGW
jgi:hypothetical protein